MSPKYSSLLIIPFLCVASAAGYELPPGSRQALPFTTGLHGKKSTNNENMGESDIPVDPLFTNGVQQVWMNNELLFSDTFGYESRRYGVEMKADNRFRIGSNTKLFTAVSIYQLQEAGKLNVSDNVAGYLDASDFEAFGFPNQSSWCPHLRDEEEICQNITFVQLMSMSSGLVDRINCAYAPGSWELEYCAKWTEFQAYPGSVASVMSPFINLPMSTAPGVGFHYTNENFIICTYIIEKLSGLSFREYIRQHITDVVGLPNTYYDPWDGSLGPEDNLLGQEYRDYHDFSVTTDVAASYHATTVCTDEFNTGSFCGTGGMISNAEDMHKWYRNLFIDRNPALLSDTSIDAIIYPRQVTSCSGDYCSYFCQGIGTDNYIGEESPFVIYYTGNMYCSATSMRLLTETATEPPLIAIAFLNNVIINASASDLDQALRSVTGTFFNIAYEMFNWETYGETRQIVAELADFFRANPDAAATDKNGGNDDKEETFEDSIVGIIVLTFSALFVVLGLMFIGRKMKGGRDNGDDNEGLRATTAKSPMQHAGAATVNTSKTTTDIQMA